MARILYMNLLGKDAGWFCVYSRSKAVLHLHTSHTPFSNNAPDYSTQVDPDRYSQRVRSAAGCGDAFGMRTVVASRKLVTIDSIQNSRNIYEKLSVECFGRRVINFVIFASMLYHMITFRALWGLVHWAMLCYALLHPQIGHTKE